MKINYIIAALALAFAAAPVWGATDAEVASKYEGYTLVFQDEFNEGDAPDPEVWKFEKGYQRNHEAQYYQQENASIKDGLLVIEGRRESKGGMSYTSASMITRDDKGLNWTYGIYEIRAKLPCFTGCWPAIWTTGSNYEWPYHGEIDIMEYYPSGGKEAIHANVAWGTTTRWNAAWNSKIKKLETYDDMELWKKQFHTWTMIYTPEYIKLYCDHDLINQVNLDQTVNPRAQYFPYDGVNPFRDPTNRQHLWLNLALGGDNGGSLANTPFPCYYYVDYVRVYVPDDENNTAINHPIIEEASEDKLPEIDGGGTGTPGSTSGSHDFTTPYNLIKDGDFEMEAEKAYPYEWREDFSVVDGKEMGAWKLNDGCDVWNVAVCLREPEPDEEYIFEGNTQFLRMQRYEKNGWAEACVSQHVAGLTKGQEYVIDAIAEWNCTYSKTTDTSRGVRVYSATADGEALNPVFTDKAVGLTDTWRTWERAFTAPSSDIVVEIFINNPWVGADGGNYNTDVWLDIDNLRLYKKADYDEFHAINGESAIISVADESADAAVEYFTLQGVRIANPGTGIFIRRQGARVSKIIRR